MNQPFGTFGHNHNSSYKVKYPDVLLYSRTVIEAREYISTGVISYAEGDIIEVEVNEFKRFDLKENVKVTVYSPVGILVFFSTIIAKAEGSVVVLSSPDLGRRFGEVRQFPRINVSAMGTVQSLAAPIESEQSLDLTVDNISLGGVGFKVFQEHQLDELCKVNMSLSKDFHLLCKVEIVHSEPKENHLYYGAKFVDLTDRTANSLRAFIMARQLETYFKRKKNNNLGR